ncbi:type VI secretion system tube protein TssD [Cytophagaceae bacterium DM2B3-1]|uniref:Type VI secretion system tube protein TssD n=2 Tax=Xanthocytophaga TaxID=3078918 RepID=A0AAE3UB42_9BACT|nr:MULTISPECIES: type VI secretion system tube protein TssD [Xanthocytophaga]MDJ1467189.1 type VI secretion system tube protein TssD [Xanthocytophaga flavus]MDJ1486121.1 type VI secretion system tube protein TssD [Xanthocytophaga flavus]MDJ1495266.1 type VI secretion system tube protein TssD [Xanthocytophaga flavus]MDJ1502998.1 type VI secretion system tube protein TssD [Xanthocytophaga agilis]
MSSFNATLQVEGGEYDVLSCNFSFGQATDDKGRPASNVKGGNLFIQIVTSDDTALLGWMIDPYKKTNGSIVFKKIDEDSTLKEVKFEDAYCVGYSESFNSTSASAMTVSLNISARKIEVSGVAHENHA